MNIQEIQAFKEKRTLLPTDFELTDWNSIAPYYDQLLGETGDELEDLKAWFKQRSELDAFLDENMAWRYIKMTCDSSSKELAQSYGEFVENIMPNWTKTSNELNKKALEHSALASLENAEGYGIMIRSMKSSVALFREENIELKTQEQLLESKYGEIAGAMTIEWEGEELPMPKASALLESTDRNVREKVWKKIGDRRLQDKEQLDDLFTEMVKLRHQIALNAGFENYRDYKFAELGRFDYTKQDCFDFHKSIEEEVLPLVNQLMLKRKEGLQLDNLRAWDLSLDIEGKEGLKPFSGQEELVEKTIACFDSLDPYFSDCISTMNTLKHLDLESRKGKAPGGYNYPLTEIGIPFIFMNAAGTIDDVITMVHEGGHAIHSFLTRDLEVTDFQSTPSEVAELASMSMELISMEQWQHFLQAPEELRRAKVAQFERVLTVLPWVATVDAYQHWIYENPEHTTAERSEAWMKIFTRFSSSEVDETGLEEYARNHWQKQLHIFEVPFYYVEYAMAQLGAIAMWKQYKETPEQGLKNYKKALAKGYLVSIPEIYKTGGIEFNFSSAYIKDLMKFVQEQMNEVL